MEHCLYRKDKRRWMNLAMSEALNVTGAIFFCSDKRLNDGSFLLGENLIFHSRCETSTKFNTRGVTLSIKSNLLKLGIVLSIFIIAQPSSCTIFSSKARIEANTSLVFTTSWLILSGSRDSFTYRSPWMLKASLKLTNCFDTMNRS